MCYHVCIKTHQQAPECADKIDVAEGQSLLAASAQHNGGSIKVGCRGGGCGVCWVKILSGNYRKKAMSKTHINEQDLASGVVLACRVFPESDMEIVPEQPAKPYNPFEQTRVG